MKLHIRNMVCDRCIMVVDSVLRKTGMNPISVTLGEAILNRDITTEEKLQIKEKLQSLGFDLIDDKKSQLVEQIKNLIVDLIHYNEEPLKINLSDYISGHIHHDYNYVSNLFSEEEGTTIEKYFIAQKIEKAKELLEYNELTLSEIAFKLNYSSVAHLSSQFKKVTGMTPSQFKKSDTKKRSPLDKV